MKKLTLALAVLAAVAVMAPQAGQAQRHGTRGQRPWGNWDQKPPREMVESFRLYKLTEYLELDESQTSQIFPRLAEMNNLTDEHRKLVREKMKELGEQVKAEKYGKAASLAEEIHRLRGEHQAAMHRMQGELMRLLSDEQKAKYMVFEQRFERHLQRMMHRAQTGDMPGPGGMGPRGNQGPNAPGFPWCPNGG
ncbi:MAG: hypothetical protein JW819_04960 [Candidatus Krumholzibacteriota bacterium]|nr:hypothetical protein [Candidatus Krumholzibacteriota bacterium]